MIKYFPLPQTMGTEKSPETFNATRSWWTGSVRRDMAMQMDQGKLLEEDNVLADA